MGRPPFGIGRTTIVCLALVVLCLTVAAQMWRSAESFRTGETAATVERITLTQRGQRADVAMVTAAFNHEGERFEVQFDRDEHQLAVGDRVEMFFEPGQPSTALPGWAVDAERSNQRFLATCLTLTAAIATALAVADRRSRLGRPIGVSYHGRTLTS